MTEDRAETEREEARRAGRSTLSYVDAHAMEASQDARRAEPEEPRTLRQDGGAKGGSTSG
jgi:hypothetical protein